MNQSGNAITPTLAAIWSKGALAIAWFEQIEIQNAYKNGRKKNKRRKKMVGLQQVRSHLPEVLIYVAHAPIVRIADVFIKRYLFIAFR